MSVVKKKEEKEVDFWHFLDNRYAGELAAQAASAFQQLVHYAKRVRLAVDR